MNCRIFQEALNEIFSRGWEQEEEEEEQEAEEGVEEE
jgi:hypothetical protein